MNSAHAVFSMLAFSFIGVTGIHPTLAAGEETRSYAVSWFYVAGYYYPHMEDCPEGLNPRQTEFLPSKLPQLGYKPAEFAQYLDGTGIADRTKMAEFRAILMNRGRIDGHAVDVYANPESVPDPHIKTGAGRYGYGFNLDGQIKPGDFIDPESGEQGVDNNLYRAFACIPLMRKPSPSGHDIVAGETEDILVEEATPAQIIEISGIDSFDNDDDVLVSYESSLDSIVRDTSGRAAADWTLRIDPNPRWHNVVHGKIHNGVLTTEPFELNLPGSPVWIQTYHFKQARLRLQFMPDGHLKGILGGYHAWFPIYWPFGFYGFGRESVGAFDVPGIYYALKRLADAYPDPKTGQNTAISTGFEIEAVPAIIIHDAPTVASRGKETRP